MSSTARIWLVSVGLVAVCADAGLAQCADADRTAIEAATGLIAVDAWAAADDRVRTAFAASPGCRELALAAWSLRGWRSARAASATGGRPEDLAPVVEAIDRLSPLGPVASDAGYAVAMLHAAAAASQDEREELQIWLDQARDLSRRLGLGTAPPRWPLTFDRAEGELWLEVDDHELAEASFAQALAVAESPSAWMGLARAINRRGRLPEACDAYRRAARLLDADAEHSLAREARAAVLMCGP